jgi:multiple sugar transport system permease protein
MESLRRSGAIFYILPALIVMALITLYPFIYTVVLSFHEWNLTTFQGKQFLGIDNYIQFFNESDTRDSLKVTLIYLVSCVGVEFILGIAIAFLFDSKFKGQNVIRNLLLFPMLMCPVVAGLIWRWILNAELGIANYVVQLIGLSPIPWLTQPRLALFSVILADIWQWTPFIFLICLAGLQAVPRGLIEAASIDGASWVDIQRYISLPIIRPVILTGLLIRMIDAIRFVDKIFVLTYGGPGSATSVLGFLIYLRGFKYFQMGLTAAYSLVLLALIILLANILIRSLKRKEK